MQGINAVDTVSQPVPSPREAQIAFVIKGEVVRVTDGDTITIKAGAGERFVVRLSDIDAPETAHRPRGRPGSVLPGQPFGKAATESLAELTPVGTNASAECYQVAFGGRLVCHVFVASLNVNLEQLKRGFAMVAANRKWIRDPQSAGAETAARDARRGLWVSPTPITPDEWRQGCWKDSYCPDAEE
jgi:micrococcal nuclease